MFHRPARTDWEAASRDESGDSKPAHRVGTRQIVTWSTERLRSAMISSRSRYLRRHRRYQRTHKRLITSSKCRPWNSAGRLRLTIHSYRISPIRVCSITTNTPEGLQSKAKNNFCATGTLATVNAGASAESTAGNVKGECLVRKPRSTTQRSKRARKRILDPRQILSRRPTRALGCVLHGDVRCGPVERRKRQLRHKGPLWRRCTYGAWRRLPG